jgi:hypothetical protein
MRWIVIALVLLLLQATVLHLFGQPLISPSGKFMLWTGDVKGPENSQQLTDWYTFSHILHGMIFYFVLHALFPKTPILLRLALAVGLEVAWEITENTPMVINQYRKQALAQGYAGDSILNSISDSTAMILGFVLASRLPALLTVIIAVALELWVGATIRDNLLLNIINFVHHFDFIAKWQSGR